MDSKTIARLPGGAAIICPNGDAEQHQALIDRRHAFVVAYSTERGWPTDPKELSIDQILEIRRQPSWQHAGSSAQAGVMPGSE